MSSSLAKTITLLPDNGQELMCNMLQQYCNICKDVAKLVFVYTLLMPDGFALKSLKGNNGRTKGDYDRPLNLRDMLLNGHIKYLEFIFLRYYCVGGMESNYFYVALDVKYIVKSEKNRDRRRCKDVVAVGRKAQLDARQAQAQSQQNRALPRLALDINNLYRFDSKIKSKTEFSRLVFQLDYNSATYNGEASNNNIFNDNQSLLVKLNNGQSIIYDVKYQLNADYESWLMERRNF